MTIESKVESKGSSGICNKNGEIIKSLAKDHDERLEATLIDACEDLGLADGIRSEIIEKGMTRFLVDKDNNLKPIGIFKTIDEMIEQMQKNNQSIVDEVKTFADERATKKHKMKELMRHYADLGDSRSYRKIRSEFASL